MSGASTARLADLARALRPQPAAQASLQTEEAQLLDAETVTSPFHDVPLFKADTIKLTDEQKAQMDTDGHLVLPGFLTDDAVDRLIASMSKIQTISSTIDQTSEGHRARAALQATFMGWMKANEDASEEVLSAKREEFQGEMEKLREQYPELRKMGVGATAMEYDEYLESCVGHPQMLSLAREVLGYDIRFDHMVALNRPGGNAPMGYHTHEYADNGSTFEDDEKFPKVGSLGPELSPDTRVPDDPSLGFIRICEQSPASVLRCPPARLCHSCAQFSVALQLRPRLLVSILTTGCRPVDRRDMDGSDPPLSLTHAHACVAVPLSQSSTSLASKRRAVRMKPSRMAAGTATSRWSR